MPLFQRGIEYLRDTLMDCAYSYITVVRQGVELGQLEAILARSFFEDVDGQNKKVVSYVIDFIIKGNNELNYLPEASDRIIYDGKTYAVRQVRKEVWRYDDPYGNLIRIHTREEVTSNTTTTNG